MTRFCFCCGYNANVMFYLCMCMLHTALLSNKGMKLLSKVMFATLNAEYSLLANCGNEHSY